MRNQSLRSSLSILVPGSALVACFALAAGCSSSSSSPASSTDAGATTDAGTQNDAAAATDSSGSVDANADAGPCSTPTGFERAVPLGAVGGKYADESLVLGPNDEPYVTFIGYDLANLQNSALYFAAYDRARCTWKTPVKIDTVEDVQEGGSFREMQLVRDASNGHLTVAYVINAHAPAPNGDTHIMLAHSADEGTTWTKEEVDHDVGAPANNNVNYFSHPTVAVAGGKEFVAYYGHFNISSSGSVGSESNGWIVKTRTGETGAFSGGVVQAASGNLGGEDLSGALATDSAGNAGFVFYSRPNANSPTLLLNYLKVGQTKAVSVFDSQGNQNDQPAFALAFEGTKPRIFGSLQRVAAPTGSSVWFSGSDDGVTWSAPVEMPLDGTDAMSHYLSLAPSPGGGLSLAIDYTASSEPRGTCGGPKLVTSTDEKKFTTCGANPDYATSDISFAGDYVQMAYTKSGKRLLAFDLPTDRAPYSAGVYVWREP